MQNSLPHSRLVVRVVLCCLLVVAGMCFSFGPSHWHNSSTFYFINKIDKAWIISGVFLLVAAPLICWKKTRPAGYFLGGLVYSFYAIAVWLAYLGSIRSSFWIFSLPKALMIPNNAVEGSVWAAANLSSLAVIFWVAMSSTVKDNIDPQRER